MAKMKFQFGFVNNDGIVELEGKFPEKMSLKQAVRFSVEKHEFILAELLAGNIVTKDGDAITCALCWYSEEISNRYKEASPFACYVCPISHKVGYTGCDETPYWEMRGNENRRQDGSFRVPYVRRQIKFLKGLEADYA